MDPRTMNEAQKTFGELKYLILLKFNGKRITWQACLLKVSDLVRNEQNLSITQRPPLFRYCSEALCDVTSSADILVKWQPLQPGAGSAPFETSLSLSLPTLRQSVGC